MSTMEIILVIGVVALCSIAWSLIGIAQSLTMVTMERYRVVELTGDTKSVWYNCSRRAFQKDDARFRETSKRRDELMQKHPDKVFGMEKRDPQTSEWALIT